MQAAKGLQMDTVAVPAIGPTRAGAREDGFDLRTTCNIYGWDRWSQGGSSRR